MKQKWTWSNYLAAFLQKPIKSLRLYWVLLKCWLVLFVAHAYFCWHDFIHGPKR